MERAGGSHGKTGSEELTERENEATSKDTLKDVSEDEKVSRSGGEANNQPPSPDGALDEDRELKDADPV